MGVTPKLKFVPCGSKVYFKSATEMIHKHSCEDPAIIVVCLGDETTPGCGWSGTDCVWNLDDFVGVNLHQITNAADRRQIMSYLDGELAVAE